MDLRNVNFENIDGGYIQNYGVKWITMFYPEEPSSEAKLKSNQYYI